jgi:hypothetical protein
VDHRVKDLPKTSSWLQGVSHRVKDLPKTSSRLQGVDHRVKDLPKTSSWLQGVDHDVDVATPLNSPLWVNCLAETKLTAGQPEKNIYI